MSRSTFAKAIWAPFLACTLLHAQQAPLLKGYVTRPGTAQDFDVDGTHILCTAATKVTLPGAAADTNSGCQPHIYGEHLAIFARPDKTTDTITAAEIASMDAVVGQSIRGLAIIDKVLSPDLLRADGFALRITPETEVHWEKPLAPSSKPAINQWIEYLGRRDASGVIVAASVVYYTSTVTAKEQKLRDKNEFDAAAVSEDAKQGRASKFFKGTDYKRIPAVHDDTQQQRIDRIGHRLIPAYQNDLPADDPNKLNFRFQLVDSKVNDCIVFPSGIILVPAAVGAALNDDELAAVLADNIAAALEKETLRHLPTLSAILTGNIIANSALLIAPAESVATLIGTGVASSVIYKHMEEQTGRMSLVLLHDAGFDIRQAPIAWWRLAGKHPAGGNDDFMQKSAPHRAGYLFETLATNWGPASPLLAGSGSNP